MLVRSSKLRSSAPAVAGIGLPRRGMGRSGGTMESLGIDIAHETAVVLAVTFVASPF
jgi:hypothetical protein